MINRRGEEFTAERRANGITRFCEFFALHELAYRAEIANSRSSR